MEFSIKVDGLDSLKKEMRKIDSKTRAIVLREVTKAATGLHADIKSDAPVGATAGLKQTIQWNVTDTSADVWASKKYAPDVEKGQKPGRWPNMEDLQLWVKKKLGVSKKRLRSVTFLVARKIHDKGTEAQPFFEPNVRRWEKRFYNNLMKAIKRL